MKIVYQNVLWLLVFVVHQYLCQDATNSTKIGVLYNKEVPQVILPLRSITKTNDVLQKTHFIPVLEQISRTDSFEAAKQLCNMISKDEGVAAIFGVESPTTSATLESICSNFEIPYILTSWRAPSTRQSGTVLNFFPEAERYARGLAKIVASLDWKSFVIIYETEEGLIRLQEVLKLQQIRTEDKRRNIVLVKQLGPGPDYRSLLKEVKTSTEYNIILDCKKELIIPILLQAKELQMLNLTNRYFLTSLDAHTLNYSVLNTTVNITTITLFDRKSEDFYRAIRNWEQTEFNTDDIRLTPDIIETETVLFHDALLLVTESINDNSVRPGVKTTPISCNESQNSESGYQIVSYMKRKPLFSALTRPVEFDQYGNRKNFNIYLVEVINYHLIATWFEANESLVLARDENQTKQASLTSLQKDLVIITSRLQAPYLVLVKDDDKVLTGNARYEGYSMDLISKIASVLNISQFEFRITEDGQYGKWDEIKKKWTGLMGDLKYQKAHLGICDLTITPQRREAVDFSMPFMTLGISILYKKPDKKEINMFAFLDPFTESIWIYTATLYLIISVVLYFISRMTPGDWENPHPCEENPEQLENIWGIKNCLWLTLGSIMTQGCDILPKGISSRMAVSMWWFFSLIMTSSYTANLAAFLTTDKMEATIDSAEALSKQTKIKYGTVDGGSTQAFFSSSKDSIYERMWINMQTSKPSVFEKNNDDGVNRVQTAKNGLYAFLMESTQIEYETKTKCNLKQVGSWLDTKYYGIAVPMNFPYIDDINRAVLYLKENGTLDELKKRWWEEKRTDPLCLTGEEKDTGDLSLAEVGGIFLVLGVGIGIALILALMEFLWNVRSISVEEHISYWKALKIELRFACNIWITRKRINPLASEPSSTGSDKNTKRDNKSVARSILHGARSIINLNSFR